MPTYWYGMAHHLGNGLDYRSFLLDLLLFLGFYSLLEISGHFGGFLGKRFVQLKSLGIHFKIWAEAEQLLMISLRFWSLDMKRARILIKLIFQRDLL